jgi:surfeit locus 1 family protein
MGGSRRDIAFLVFSVLAFSLLTGLGVWQVQRLAWKQDLIARMEAQVASEPVRVREIEARLAAGEDVEFMRVTATGRFVHDRELFVFTTRDGEMGWKLVTPLDMGDTGLLVDRGFIPYDLKAPAARPESRSEGTVSVTGVVWPHAAGRAPFVPDNDVDANIWHWWALPAMAEAAGVERAAPFILQAEPQPGDPAWPLASIPDPADIPNRHLGYAITWFGLAAMLVVVNGLYLARRRRPPGPSA